MVKDLIDKTARHKPKHFIAPVMSKRAKLFVVQDSIPYWFFTEVEYPNWYYLQPNLAVAAQSVPVATPIRQANPHEYISYMSALPSFQVITLFPISDTVWLVMPYNIADAGQRGWRQGMPRSMYLVMDNIASMDVVTARFMPPQTLIFDHLSGVLKIAHREMEIARDIFDRRLDAIRKHEARRQRRSRLKTEEGRLQESLKFMGAELEDWTRGIDGYSVRWKIDGQVYKTEIDTNMRVVSAGVCLGGTDNWHSLASVVEVMQDRDAGRGRSAYEEDEDW